MCEKLLSPEIVFVREPCLKPMIVFIEQSNLRYIQTCLTFEKQLEDICLVDRADTTKKYSYPHTYAARHTRVYSDRSLRLPIEDNRKPIDLLRDMGARNNMKFSMINPRTPLCECSRFLSPCALVRPRVRAHERNTRSHTFSYRDKKQSLSPRHG
jgi:hypothetical protein